ncbi:hypothetical protein G7054_g11700 [Neopestalotiopsis clavispora]|nr:hypothetical protein G7054_g11700 [Neopestalotiopsis clavispora]
MDDPWGSPWASAPSDAASKNDHPPSPSLPPKSLLSLPPKAFFGGSLNSPGQSPWADHGFGDWASPGPVDDSASNLQWGSWGESGLTPKAESPGKQSPIAWPSSTATSPGLRPMRSRSSTFFRQSSPDPWANDTPWRDGDERRPSRAVSIISATDVQKDTVPVDTQVVIHVEEPRAGIAEETDLRDQLHARDGRREGATPASNGSLAAEPEGHESPSRPSSTFSAESSHGQEQQDSPITSVDEEVNFRPRKLRRKPSSKVSDLVGLYDGLARAASDGSESRPASRKKALGLSQEANDETVDAGGGDACGGDVVLEQEPSVLEDSRISMSSGGSSTPRIQPQNRLSQSSHAQSDGGHDPVADAHALALRELTEKYGTITFNPDVKMLDKAFDSKLDPGNGEYVAPDGLTDRIITDSFETVDERKAWYRVSRFGSMRKHDSGDEENYHRITWQTSRLHDDAIKIVRRWMEEDSISGKPILGGGKRTSAFNWDSASAPVALDKVFARRSLGGRPKAAGSSVPMGHTPTSSIGSLNSVTEEPRFLPGPGGSLAPSSIGTPSASVSPITNFGWTPQQSQSINGHHGEVLKKSNDDDDDEDDEEEDDWGEMVFSPTQAAFTSVEDEGLSRGSLDDFSKMSVAETPSAHTKSGGQQACDQPSNPQQQALEANAPVLYSHEPSRNVRSGHEPDTDPWTPIDLNILETPSATVPVSLPISGAASVAWTWILTAADVSVCAMLSPAVIGTMAKVGPEDVSSLCFTGTLLQLDMRTASVAHQARWEQEQASVCSTGDDTYRMAYIASGQHSPAERRRKLPRVMLAVLCVLLLSSTGGIALAIVLIFEPGEAQGTCLSRDLILYAALLSLLYMTLHIRAALRDHAKRQWGPPHVYGDFLHASALVVARLSIVAWICALIATAAMIAKPPSPPLQGLVGKSPILNLLLCIGALEAYNDITLCNGRFLDIVFADLPSVMIRQGRGLEGISNADPTISPTSQQRVGLTRAQSCPSTISIQQTSPPEPAYLPGGWRTECGTTS